MKEKIDHLGEDLRGSGWMVHIAPARPFVGRSDGRERPSAYSFLTADSLERAPLMRQIGTQKLLFVTPHPAGEEIVTWGVGEELRRVLILRREERVGEYIHAIQKILEKFIRMREDSLAFQRGVSSPLMREYYNRIKENFVKAKVYLENLKDLKSADEAVSFLIHSSQLAFEVAEKSIPVIGVIFAFNAKLNGKAELPVTVGPRSWDGGTGISEQVLQVATEPGESSGWFYNELLHGLYVPSPDQSFLEEVQASMLSATQDRSERRVPIYDCHGRLVWPK